MEQKTKKRQINSYLIHIFFIFAVSVASVFIFDYMNTELPIHNSFNHLEYSDFIGRVRNKEVDKVEISGQSIKLRTFDGETHETFNPGDGHLIDDLLVADVQIRIKESPSIFIRIKESPFLRALFSVLLPVTTLLFLLSRLIKKYIKITYLENSITSYKRQAPVGFSWTVFFFGFFPALIRGDWKWGVVMFLCSLVTLGLSQFIFCFIYNKLYVKDLLNDGYEIVCVKNLVEAQE
jgi:hypothetical protein